MHATKMQSKLFQKSSTTKDAGNQHAKMPATKMQRCTHLFIFSNIAKLMVKREAPKDARMLATKMNAVMILKKIARMSFLSLPDSRSLPVASDQLPSAMSRKCAGM